LIAVAVVALVAGCANDDKADVSAAKRFGDYPLFYLGKSFQGEPLTEVPQSGLNSFIYGDCEAKSDSGCAPPIELQQNSICDLNPLYVRTKGLRVAPPQDGPYRRMRGTLAHRVDGMVVYAGSAAVKIYTNADHPTREIVAALRPVNGPAKLGHDLPPPRFPRTMLRELRRSESHAQLKRLIASLPRAKPTPC
jgi:hypothetical protein